MTNGLLSSMPSTNYIAIVVKFVPVSLSSPPFQMCLPTKTVRVENIVIYAI
jgi:hypothetical protein